MTRFTDSPYERMMTQKPEGRKKTSRKDTSFHPSLSKCHPCYGCGNYGRPCVGFCHWELERQLRRRPPQEKGGTHGD